MATTTTLTSDLQNHLTAVGLTDTGAARVTNLIPPAGQHHLLTALRDNPNALKEFAGMFLGDLADRLRCTWVEADVVRAHLELAVQR